MKPLDCIATRRRLQAYHDEELRVDDQIAVSSHLEWCDDCAGVFEDLQTLRSLIRSSTRERSICSTEEESGLRHNVVNRMKAERSLSWRSRVGGMFEDLRLVYAGLGASVAAATCILLMLNMMRVVNEDPRIGSLAATISSMASSSASRAALTAAPARPVVVSARLLLPPSSEAPFAADSDADVNLDYVDAEYALIAVVTREGRVTNVELVRASSGQTVPPGTQEARALQKLMTAVARGRYEPAKVNGLPVATNKMWLVAHTTVHPKTPLDRPVSISAKKRLTGTTDAPAARPV